MFTGQRVNPDTPFEFTDMSVKEPYDSGWKDRVRTRIRRSDGVIALISSSTPNADGELWEIQCAVEEGKPLMGIWLEEGYRTKPSIMGQCAVQVLDVAERRRLHRQPVGGSVKRALLVGVNDYDNFSPLSGCVNDVDAVEPLLARSEDGTPNFACQKRTSSLGRVVRDSLLADVDALLAPGADVGLLYFAGHGSNRENDVILATQDGTEGTLGLSLSEILTKVQGSQVGEVIVILDSCFSGAAGGVPQLGTSASALRGGVSILAASRADQTAAETASGRGLFSTYLCGGLDGGQPTF